MQTAMNNMMNNSQLQRMLHSAQVAPCAIETSQSDTSSPSPPDSPRSASDLSRDSESVVPMDTSMSSASSCSSDSGEEDAPSNGLQRDDLFAYKRPVSSPRAGSVSPASSDTLSTSSKDEERQPQECWNRWNGDGQRRTDCERNMRDASVSYREHVTGYQMTQQSSQSPSQNQYHTYNGNNMNEVQRGGYRRHLVSDLLLTKAVCVYK